MNFASDNWAGATPAVMAALARHNAGFAPAYGGDPLTAEIEAKFSEIFEREVEVFFVASGTGANAISMAAAARPGGLIFCSSDAHILLDECGASEFFTSGMKLIPVPTRHGLIQADGLAAALARYPDGGRGGVPATLSLTQASECGTVYSLDQVRELAALATARGLVVHMDGARFANGVAAVGASPADITWRAGVDLLSFGGTKNGCWAAEAIVVFEPGRFPDLAVLRQRAGHTLSKSRFVAAQFEGYFEAGGWLKTAAHANAMARLLREGIVQKGGRLAWPSEANEVFPILPAEANARLKAAGAMFHPWAVEGLELAASEEMVRLVTSFATNPVDVKRFVGLL